MKDTKHKAFTLVELIVVVTILAILATIGFVSYSSYLTGVRDTNRLAQLVSIHDGLELYRTKNDLPLPDDNIEIQANGITIAYQWYAGGNTLDTIDFTKWGKDPKDGTYFSYYLTKDRKYFQLMWLLEEENLTSQILSSPLRRGFAWDIAFAVDYTDRVPTTYGKKLWIFTNEYNTPVQEIVIENLDIVTTSKKYVAHLRDDYKISGTGAYIGVLLHSLTSPKKTPTNCKEKLSPKTHFKDGIYTIILNNEEVDVYCDMTTNGGWWTLVKRIGELWRNWKSSWDRVWVMTEDSQMWVLSDLRPDWEEFAKLSDTDINYMNFSEVMHTQDWSNDVVFVYTSVIDSDLVITESSSFNYKIWVDWEIKASSLTSVWGWCTKRWIYISKDLWYTACGWPYILSIWWYIHTLNNNGFWINGTYVYTDNRWSQWIR